jgi:hypothetical protein
MSNFTPSKSVTTDLQEQLQALERTSGGLGMASLVVSLLPKPNVVSLILKPSVARQSNFNFKG